MTCGKRHVNLALEFHELSDRPFCFDVVEHLPAWAVSRRLPEPPGCPVAASAAARSRELPAWRNGALTLAGFTLGTASSIIGAPSSWIGMQTA